MEKIKVLVVEDMSLTAEAIAAALEKHNMQVIGMYDSGEEALLSLYEQLPDLVLLDIHLSGKLDGIAVAEKINKSYNLPIIYLSDHVDAPSVARAKKTHPASYLSKPFNEKDLILAIEIAFENWQTQESHDNPLLRDYIFIKDEQRHIKLSYDDIVYLEAGRSYCYVVTDEKKYLQSNNMAYVFDQINHKNFLKVHRSYIINVNKITAIEGNMIILGKYTVEMSKSKRDELIPRLKIL